MGSRTIPDDTLAGAAACGTIFSDRSDLHFRVIDRETTWVSDYCIDQGIADRVLSEGIVIASHGKTGLKKYFLGSVAKKVTKEAKCPVLLIRNPEPEEAS